MMKRLTAILSTFALVVCCLGVLSGCSQDNKDLKLGTGNEQGNYYKFGEYLAQEVKNSKDASEIGTIVVEPTAGSSANLRLLSQGFLDLAIVQADTLSDAYNGTGFFSNSGAYRGYSAVAGLYTEACQIIVRADSNITSVEDLAGKRVSLGERESGVLQNATQILDAYNLRETDFTPEYLSFSDSEKALEEGKIDAAFITAAIPTPAVTKLSEAVEVRVLPVDAEAAKQLMKRHPYYTTCTIPANTYAGQTQEIQTVGVRAVLVARNSVPANKIAALLSLIYSGEIQFAENLGNALVPALDEATAGIPVPFHQGASDYYATQMIAVDVISNKDDGSSVSAGLND